MAMMRYWRRHGSPAKLTVLLSELLWVWIPSAIALAMIVYRKGRRA